MKRSWWLFALLLACNEAEPGADDGIGNGAQPGCNVPEQCQADSMRYQSCLNSACDSQYQACYGPDYARNIYNGGPCSSWQTCVDHCACNTACQTACGNAPLTCIDCLSGPLQVCLLGARCELVSCEVDAGVMDACKRLSACCAQQTDPAKRTACTQLYTNLSPAGDNICAGVIPTFCP